MHCFTVLKHAHLIGLIARCSLLNALFIAVLRKLLRLDQRRLFNEERILMFDLVISEIVSKRKSNFFADHS